jgi:outer membrane murein-binding lipoprotein Lpp
VSATGEFLLGIIALSVLVMAVVQVGAIFAGIRLAKRVDQLAVQLDQEIKPLIANLTALSSEAARAASLAAKQAERLDRVFGELVYRVDETLARSGQAGDGHHGRRQGRHRRLPGPARGVAPAVRPPSLRRRGRVPLYRVKPVCH